MRLFYFQETNEWVLNIIMENYLLTNKITSKIEVVVKVSGLARFGIKEALIFG